MRDLTLRAIVLAAAVCLAARADATSYVIIVGTDDATDNGNCTLREALIAATTDAPRDACAAGSPVGADTITLIGSFEWTLGPFLVVARELVVRGAGFPFAALLDLGDHSRFLTVLAGSAITIENLQVRDGNALADAGNPRGGFVFSTESAITLRDVDVVSSRAYGGGGIFFSSDGPPLLVERCQFSSNVAENSSEVSPRGGGLFVGLGGTARARLVDTVIADNRVQSTIGAGSVAGGGLAASVNDNAVLEIHRVAFEGNVADSGPGTFSASAGAELSSDDAAYAVIADTTWTGNDLQAGGHIGGSALTFVASGTGASRLERARFRGNDVGESVAQVYLGSLEQANLTASSLLIADGSDTGLQAGASDASTVRIGHATIVGAVTGAKLATTQSGIVRVENSLFWNNNTDVVDTVPSALDPSTMTGVDPLFVAPAVGDYRLGAGSPAIDFGNRLLPSVGPFDLAHAPRVVGAQTDAGAFERGGLFGDGLESGDVGAWSAAAP